MMISLVFYQSLPERQVFTPRSHNCFPPPLRICRASYSEGVRDSLCLTYVSILLENIKFRRNDKYL